MDKTELYNYIDDGAKEYCALSDKIWDFAELSLCEHESAKALSDALEAEGFAVTRGVSGMDTAFIASFGSGSPTIGILGEYDALSRMSQTAGSLNKEELVAYASGHGCGHNLLGAGSLAAAVAVKKYMEAHKLSGTVKYYGCPGEEGGAGKAFMARDGVFYELDAALTWHPSDVNEATTNTNIASIQIEYIFDGVSSHASAAPQLGRSALDAVELMNTGVQYLREHIDPDMRVHYAITDAGGVSPNVVQPQAKVLYMMRAKNVVRALTLVKRVDLIAAGAAMMTETKLSRRFIDGTASTLMNTVVAGVLYRNMIETKLPEYTAEEKEFASALKSTYAADGKLPGTCTEADACIAAQVDVLTESGTRAINDFVMPCCDARAHVSMGSTDVGDVSWQTPTAQIYALTLPSGTPGHSWQVVSCSKTSLAHKGMLYAAKVISGAAIDLMCDPQTLKLAKEEFCTSAHDGYVCPIEDGAKPQAI